MLVAAGHRSERARAGTPGINAASLAVFPNRSLGSQRYLTLFDAQPGRLRKSET